MTRLGRIRRAGGAVAVHLHDDHFELVEGDDLATLRPTGVRLPRDDRMLLAPVAPSKIVAVGLNYRAHAAEMGKRIPEEPLLFVKPSTAVVGPGEPIVAPPESIEVHHEAELAVVIGRPARRVSPARAREHVLGMTCLNDVTARDIQRREGHYTRAKGFDTFAPLGPWIAVGEDVGDRAVVCRVNGTERQRGRTGDLVFDPYTLVAYASCGMTLLPGDVVSTGTPPGVGPLAPGDRVEVEVEGVGVLANPVVAGRRRVFLGLGGNLGDREEALVAAVHALAAEPDVRVVRGSSLFDTAPVGPEQPRYLNAVVEVETALELPALLRVAKEIERRLGRVPSERYGPRALDIDLLLADQTVDAPELRVPHPRLSERAFVLAPLAELAPDAVVCAGGRTVRTLLAEQSSQDVRRVDGDGRWGALGWPR